MIKKLAWPGRNLSPQLWFSSIISVMSVMLMGACALYALNTLPFVDFENTDRSYWLVQGDVFVGYGLLILAMWASIGAVDKYCSARRHDTMLRRTLIASLVIPAGAAAALAIVILPLFRLHAGKEWLYPSRVWLVSSILGVVVYVCLLMHRTAVAQRENTLRAQLETDTLATALDRTELSMLEAQIEPHFLFNTLAHIKRQYRNDPVTADQMLGALIDYFDRALPALRRTDWTVDDELGLILAYLDILAQRFGSRLRFAITACDESKTVQLPALTIATLVENAIRHGITPKPDGGTVFVSVQMDASALHIEVCDSGVGLQLSSGTGLGLATVRARLKSAFGGKARLVVEPGYSGGVRAAIQIPLTSSDA